MPTNPLSPPSARGADRDEVRAERAELLGHLQAGLEPVMIVLGLVFLGLLVVDYSGLKLSAEQRAWVDRGETGIYWIFVGDFLLRFVVAPEKLRFVRGNWLTALSLVLPFLRPLRALRAAGALRSIHLVRVLSGANRGMRALRLVTRGRQLAYLVALSVMVILLGAGSTFYLDRGAAGTPIRSYGEAVWWAATLVTTINSGDDPVTVEGRVVAVLMRVYALSVFGYITASIASYLIGRPPEEAVPGQGAGTAEAPLREQVTALHRELGLLRQELAARGGRADEATDRAPSRTGDD